MSQTIKDLIARAHLNSDDKTALDELARALTRGGYGQEDRPEVPALERLLSTPLNLYGHMAAMQAKIENASWGDVPPRTSPKKPNPYSALIAAALGTKKTR